VSTAQAILDSLNRARLVCVVCRGKSGHPPIVGDGPPRCYACVVRLVHIATGKVDSR
jgi:hypothetical protein